MNKKKLASLGLSISLTTSMVATPMAGIYADTETTPGSDPGNEISSENENAQPTSIVEAEENIDKASEAVKQKADNLSKIKDEVEYDKKAKAVSDTSANLASSTKLLDDKKKAVSDADTNLKNAQSKQAEAKEAYDKAVADTKQAKDAYEKIKAENPNAEEEIEQDKEKLKKIEADLVEKKAALEEAKAKEAEAKNAADKKADEAKVASDALKNAEAKVAEKKAAKAEAEKTLKDAKDKLDELTVGNPKYQEAKEAVDAAKAELDKANNELNDAQNALTQAKTNEENKTKELDEKQKALKEALEEKTKYDEDCARLEGEIKKAKNIADNLAKDYNAKKQIEAQAEDKLKQANKEVDEAKAGLEKARSELALAVVATQDAMNEKNLADKAVEDAKAEVETAKNKMKLTPEEIQKAKEQWAKGSVGFFEQNGSTEALAVFTTNKTGSDGTSYLDPTKNAGENDARDLDRMKMSIEAIAEINKKRQSDGGIDGRKLSIVGINDYCMAIAQANANFSNNKFNHASVYQPPYENLYWGPATTANGNMSPLSGWWDEEKVIFDYLKNEVGLKSRNEMINYIASHQQELQKKFPDFISLAVGHYTNIVDDLMWTYGKVGRDSKVAGYAIRPGMYGYVHSLQLSPNEVGKTYTYEDYKANFMKYYNDLKMRTEGKNPNGQAAYDEAVAKLNAAIEKQKAVEAKLNNAKTEEAKKQTAVAEAEKLKDDKDALALAAKDAYEKAQTDSNDAKDKLDKANSDVQKAEKALTDYQYDNAGLGQKIDFAKEDVANAEKALTEAKTGVKNAENAVADKTNAKKEAEQKLAKAKAALDAVSKEITDAKKAVEEAQKAFDSSSAELTQAEQEKAEASTKSQKAAEEKIKAEKEYQNQLANVKKKSDEVNRTEKDKQAAEKQLDEDNKKFAALVNASKVYDDKVAEEKKAEEKLDNATKNAEEKAEALQKANNEKTKAETDLRKAEAANEQAKKAFKEAEEAVAKSEKEYKDAVDKLDSAKVMAQTLLELIQGNNAKLTINSDGDYVISCNGSIEYFTGITIDGQFIPLSSGEYTAKPGSTIVTISKAYWNKLKEGNHTFQFNYKYGNSPVGTFTLTAKADNNTQNNGQMGSAVLKSKAPNTGDPNSFVLLPTGLVLLGSLLAARKLRKKEEN